ncbi:MAG: hypothetical protein ACFB13_08570 [Kiloniellaceae bacterium]
MTPINIAIALAALLLAGVVFNPRVMKAPFWRATVTPLASIIGSGFLVAGPILAHTAGTQAWLAMLALCGIAYLFGGALRYNILYVEPTIASQPSRLTAGIERASDLALSLAYFISVAYYLNLFAAFGLRMEGVIDPFWIRVAATTTIAAIGIIGALGGLTGLERLEVGTVGLKLCLIGGLFAALAVASIGAVETGRFEWPEIEHTEGLHEVGILLGLVILVQGFETSRYLGSKYDAALRVRSMKWAQWIATAIYLVFILLITRYFTDGLPTEGGETAIIDMLTPVSAVIAPLIIIAALASQLSAAVADLNGAGGLLAEIFGQRVTVNLGNVVTAAVAIAVTWAANIYEIIAYASQAFVAYYALQAAQAALAAHRRQQPGLAALYGGGVVIALVIIAFATPVSV